jgi:hypothetical protein
MKEIRLLTLLGLLLAALLPLSAEARKPRDRAEMRAFRQENPCPVTGLVQDICPGWHVGYITPLCDNGTDTRTNMRWMTLEDKRFMTAANGKNCSKRKHPQSTLR